MILSMSPEVSGSPENLDALHNGRFEEILGSEQYSRFSSFLNHEVRQMDSDTFAIRLTSIVDEGQFYSWVIYKINGAWDEDILLEPNGLVIPSDDREFWLTTPDVLRDVPTFIPNVPENYEELYGN